MVHEPWSTVRFNSPPTNKGKGLETVKTLHVQFFPFSQKWTLVTVNLTVLRTLKGFGKTTKTFLVNAS